MSNRPATRPRTPRRTSSATDPPRTSRNAAAPQGRRGVPLFRSARRFGSGRRKGLIRPARLRTDEDAIAGPPGVQFFDLAFRVYVTIPTAK